MSRILGWQIAVPQMRVPSISRSRRLPANAPQRPAQRRRPALLGCVASTALESPRRPKPQPPTTPNSVGLRPALSPRFWLEPADQTTIDRPTSASLVPADLTSPLAELAADGSFLIATPCTQGGTRPPAPIEDESLEAMGSETQPSTLREVQNISPACDHIECRSSHFENDAPQEEVQTEPTNSTTSAQSCVQCQNTQFFCIADGDDEEAECEYFPALPALGNNINNVNELPDEIEVPYFANPPDAAMLDAGEGADAVQWLAKVVLTAMDASPHGSKEVSGLHFDKSIPMMLSPSSALSSQVSKQTDENVCQSDPFSANVGPGASSSPPRGNAHHQHIQARPNPLTRNEPRPRRTPSFGCSEPLFPLLSAPHPAPRENLLSAESMGKEEAVTEDEQLVNMVSPACPVELEACPCVENKPQSPSAKDGPPQCSEVRRNPLTGKPSRLRAVSAVPEAPVPPTPSATAHPAPTNLSAADGAAKPAARKPTMSVTQDPAAVPKRRESPGPAQRKLLSPLPPTPMAAALMQPVPLVPVTCR